MEQEVKEEEKEEEKPTPTTCEDDAPEKSAEPTEQEKQDEPPPTEVKSSGKPKGKKGGGKDKPKNVKSNTGGEQVPEKELILHCVTCNNEFPTRNKLFDHLKTTGHASPLTSGAAHSSVTKSKKDKKKNR